MSLKTSITCSQLLAALVVVAALRCESSPGQSLPPAGDNPPPARETRRIAVGEEAKLHAVAAIKAFRAGDFTQALGQLADPLFVVDFERELPADALSPHELTLARSLACFAKGDLRGAHDLGLTLGAGADVEALALRDYRAFMAYVFWRLQVFPLAESYALDISPSDSATEAGSTPFGDRTFQDVLRDVGAYGYESDVSPDVLESFCSASKSIQPWAYSWFEKRDASTVAGKELRRAFLGALTVSDLNQEPGGAAEFWLVYRDLDGPPIPLLKLGETMPRFEALEEFAKAFRYDRPSEPRAPNSLRIQMEAAWFQSAGIAPLTAAWCRATGADPDAVRPVREAMTQAHAWDWQPLVRYHVGSGRPPEYEVIAYANRQTVPEPAPPDVHSWNVAAALAAPLALEHYYFILAGSEDRRYVAAYRLVSEPLPGGDRVYAFQRVQGNEISVVDVFGELPAPEELSVELTNWLAMPPGNSPASRGLLFNELDTTEGPVRGEALADFLGNDGITLRDVTPGTEVEIRAVVEREQGRDVFRNRLCQTGDAALGEFTLEFARPIVGLMITRDVVEPKILRGRAAEELKQGAWRVTALDLDGQVVDRIEEGAYQIEDDRLKLPTLLLQGAGIVSVRFENRLAGRWILWGDLSFDLSADEKATDDVATARSQILQLTQAIDVYREQRGVYPKSPAALVEPSADAEPAAWRGPYLATILLPPDPWGTVYKLKAPGKHNPATYDVWSAGPDGMDETADDIGNWSATKP
ncbi:MAG: type II secretion system protein GspG [Planctomycetaceae bacterium]|nr:type II secretion system protein GspG [Planctomycetaceae bacterium]